MNTRCQHANTAKSVFSEAFATRASEAALDHFKGTELGTDLALLLQAIDNHSGGAVRQTSPSISIHLMSISMRPPKNATRPLYECTTVTSILMEERLR